MDGVLWGNLQFKDGPNKYGVRKSVFFYDPTLLPGFPYDPNAELDVLDLVGARRRPTTSAGATTTRTSSPRTGRCTASPATIPA